MGLGLATAHSFIYAHGGSIEVNSEAGKGATFIVKLKATSPDTTTPASSKKGKAIQHS